MDIIHLNYKGISVGYDTRHKRWVLTKEFDGTTFKAFIQDIEGNYKEHDKSGVGCGERVTHSEAIKFRDSVVERAIESIGCRIMEYTEGKSLQYEYNKK